jgi:hypothetical protein
MIMATFKQVYHERRKAGKCVRVGCDKIPQKNEDGSRRSYCDFHNKQNAKYSQAYADRQNGGKASKARAPKAKPKAKAKKPAPQVVPATVPAVPEA